MTILTVTLNPAVDVFAAVPSSNLSASCTALRPRRARGGGGINVARAIHRLGGAATALFPSGGSSGDLLCELLRHEGVAILPVPIAGITREDFAVTEVSTGHQYRFVLPGPTLSAAELDRCVDEVMRRLEPGSFVVLSGSLPKGMEASRLADIITAARERRCVVVVDTSGPALTAAARAGAFLLKPSANELSGHAGRRLSSTDDIADSAHELLRSGPNHAVLVSLAAAGGAARDRRRPHRPDRRTLGTGRQRHRRRR